MAFIRLTSCTNPSFVVSPDPLADGAAFALLILASWTGQTRYFQNGAIPGVPPGCYQITQEATAGTVIDFTLNFVELSSPSTDCNQCIIDNPPIQPNCDHCDEGYDWQTILEPEYYGDCETTSGPHKHCYNPCTVFFTTRLGVFSYNFYTGEYVEVLDVSGHVDTTITNGTVYENKYWIIGTLGDGHAIREYDITFSPLSYIGITPLPIALTLSRTLFNPNYIVPLTAKSNTLLLGGTTTVEQYDITGLTPVTTPIFTLPNSGIINRMLYIPGPDRIYLTGNDSIGSYIAEYELTGSTTPIWRIDLPSGNYCGIYSDYLGNLYITGGIPGGSGNSTIQYLVDVTGNTVVPIANLPFPGNVGGSQSPTCSLRNAEYWSATLVCECADPLCYYFASPNVPFIEGLSNIPLLTTFAGLTSACWDLRYVGGIANVPQGCVEYPDGSLLILSDITSITEQQCTDSCANRIIGNIQLTSCCNGQVVVVKSNFIVYPGTYVIPQLAIDYPWAGNCWKAESSTVPQEDININDWEVTIRELCAECTDELLPSQLPCDCPQPICYELIPCPGVITVNLFASNDLSAYVNSVVMVDGLCYTVQPGTENCNGAQVIEIFDTFAQCGDQSGQPNTAGCQYCDCPPDYYPNADKTECIKTDCETPTLNGSGEFHPIVRTDGGTPNTWGNGTNSSGAQAVRFYEEITNKIFPIDNDNVSPWVAKDDGGAGSVITWVAPANNTFDFRLRSIAIWPLSNPLDKWIGITVCITVTEDKIYSFGMAADSQYILKHNGVQIVQSLTTGVSAYRLFAIHQLFLSAGQHVFEFFGLNILGTGGIGFEVYNAPASTLQTITPAALPGVIVFSTKDLPNIDTPNFLLGDNAYACADGYFLNNCAGASPMCCKVPKILPFIHCEPSYLVESCEEGVEPVITNSDLSAQVGTINRICIDPIAPPAPYTDCQLCDPDYTWIPRPEGSTYEGDCRTPDNGTPFMHCYNPCTVFFNGKKGEIYSHNQYSGLTIQIANLAGTMASNSNIANTSDKLWVLGVTNLILEYDITFSPLGYTLGVPNPITITFNTSYPPSVPTVMRPLCAVDNNLLLGGLTSVIEYYINGPTVVFNTLFSLTNSGVIQDLVFSPVNSNILILGTDSIGPFIGEYDYSGNQLNRANLSFTDFTTILITPEGYIRVVRGTTPYEVYNISLVPVWSQDGAPVSNVLGLNPIGGGSQNPGCTNVVNNPSIWPAGCYCYTVTEIPYEPSEVLWPYTPISTFEDCETCLTPCYALTSCPEEGVEPTVIIVNNDLSGYIGRVIKFPRLGDGCWIISLVECDGTAITVPGEYTTYTTCELCNPVIPPPPITTCRTVKPGYDTPGCSIEYTERISCTFGKQAFDEMVKTRYGIKICCDHEMDKWDVRWEILKLKAIFDPTLCNTIVPTPSITWSYSYECVGNDAVITINATFYCGSGQYQMQKLSSSKIWENFGSIYIGPKTGDVTFTLDAGDLVKDSFRIIDVLACSLISNVIATDFDCDCSVESIVSSGSFECVQPLNGDGILSWNNYYECGSGNYKLQLKKGNSWDDGIIYNSVTDGSDVQTVPPDEVAPGTLTFRVVDTTTNYIGNEFDVVIPNCGPIAESIILNDVSYVCLSPTEGELSGNFTVTNGSGDYDIQTSLNGIDWVTIQTITGGATSGTLGWYELITSGVDVPGDYQVRIVDITTPYISNSLPITIYNCDTELVMGLITPSPGIGVYGFSVDYTNAYEVSPLSVELTESILVGGPYFVILNLVINTNPQFGTIGYSNITMTSGFFYRITAKDVQGTLIYSNIQQAP